MAQNRIFPDVMIAAIHIRDCYNELKADMHIPEENKAIGWDVTNKKEALDFITEELMTEWGNLKTLTPKQASPFILAEAFEIYNAWLELEQDRGDQN